MLFKIGRRILINHIFLRFLQSSNSIFQNKQNKIKKLENVIRLLLEFAVPVWSPALKGDKDF